MSRILVTGGSGFIGSALVKALARDGHRVRVLDDNSRGSPRRLAEVAKDIEFIAGDIRNAATVEKIAHGVDEVYHLAFVNGTEFFYSQPDLVLDVGVRGMINVIDACHKHGIGTLVLASSSEVYQTPPKIPTDESVPLTIPDPLNPRYSYGAGKLISEIMAINFGRKYFERVLIFRPHNIYGPDMGWEHVIPQIALRLDAAAKAAAFRYSCVSRSRAPGKRREASASSTTWSPASCSIRSKGEHLGIYHVGTTEEITIAELARRIAAYCRPRDRNGLRQTVPGSTARRCPDISKLARLGYKPRVPLSEGLKPTLDWYWRNASSHQN